MARSRGGASLKFLLVLAFLALASFTHAQITELDDMTSAPIPGAGHDYINLLSESVNPANGTVNLSLKLPMPKGRGFSLPFSFEYNSGSVAHLTPAPGVGLMYWQDNISEVARDGWAYVIPTAGSSNWTVTQSDHTTRCTYVSNFMFEDLEGVQHQFGLGNWFRSGGTGSCPGNTINTIAGDSLMFAAFGEAIVRPTIRQ